MINGTTTIGSGENTRICPEDVSCFSFEVQNRSANQIWVGGPHTSKEKDIGLIIEPGGSWEPTIYSAGTSTGRFYVSGTEGDKVKFGYMSLC